VPTTAEQHIDPAAGGVSAAGRTWRTRHRALLAGALAGVVLLVGGGVTAGYAYAGDVPRGTKVLGIDLGGKSREEAGEALRAGLARRTDQLDAAVQVRIGDQVTQVKPADVGLSVDVPATVAAAARGGSNPVGLLFGSRTVKPVVTADAARLEAALRATADKAGQALRKPAITFAGTTPKAVYPRPGRALDPDGTAEALREGWLSGGRPVDVPLVERQPATTAEEVDRLVAELARPAVAAPVTARTSRGTVVLPPSVIAASLVLAGDESGKITPRVDEKKLRAAAADQLATVEVAPKEARVALTGGRPRVVASSGGLVVDTAALSRDLLAVLPSRDGRTVEGVLKEVEPATTTEDVARLGIKERVSTFTTKFTGGLSSPRSQNIVQVAKEVDGAVVKPGETFSLNGHTGPRGYDEGYQDAPVIVDGKLTPGVGGGISQFTTTLFNASYYAGLEDVEHKPHSYWFSRYPPVIESTIFYPDLDFKFRNDSRYGVLIDTSYTADSITVSMWSTKVYDSVTTEWSPRRNVTKPKTIRLGAGPNCLATDGLDGFTQDAWRIFRQGGKEIRREKFTWTYQAEPRYLCGEEQP
jgi:vancomycin resistance protein YoaR